MKDKHDTNDTSSDYHTCIMNELGAKGWKMTHIMSWRLLKEDWKKKPDSMYFQRPLHKK